MSTKANLERRETGLSADWIGSLAADALLLELNTWPKPGLVSPVDSGSHPDMDAAMFRASAAALRPFFTALAAAGAAGAEMDDLRTIGRAAERSMLAVTGAVNTHRGAIFSLGLLCAAAGALRPQAGPFMAVGALGAYVRRRWGNDILGGPQPTQSHGARAWRRYGAGGARAEAAAGFPHVYRAGLPALIDGRRRAGGDENAACVQACFALIAQMEDTNLLHRGGLAGLRFAAGQRRIFWHRAASAGRAGKLRRRRYTGLSWRAG